MKWYLRTRHRASYTLCDDTTPGYTNRARPLRAASLMLRGLYFQAVRTFLKVLYKRRMSVRDGITKHHSRRCTRRL
jgi:hypothetical protein